MILFKIVLILNLSLTIEIIKILKIDMPEVTIISIKDFTMIMIHRILIINDSSKILIKKKCKKRFLRLLVRINNVKVPSQWFVVFFNDFFKIILLKKYIY